MTGFGTAESGVDRSVVRSFVIIATFVLTAPWLAIAVSDFGSARIAGLLLLPAIQLSSPAQKRVIRAVRADMDLGFS